MTEWYGWHGCILRVDLSRRKITKEPLSEDLVHNFLGGRGVNSKILYDVPPRNMLEIPYPDGPSKGRTIDMVEFEKLKDAWYELRGSDKKTGAPTRETLEKLDLKYVADELEKTGVYKE